jgi:DNA-binding MarR family transcriptional regulator
MISRVEREDLGAQFARITRRLVDAERPLLAAHGLSMWAYIALSHLARQPAGTQLALAQAIQYDKTRLISLLDGLEREGLITREPDPADRRARIVQLTAAGEARHAAAQGDVRAMEDELLGDLSAADRRRLGSVLSRLASEPA